MALTVEGETLASRPVPNGDIIKVCIPARMKMEPLDEKGRTRPTTKSRELKAASAVLMRILGTGIGTRTIKGGVNALTSRSTRARAARARL